LIDIGTELPATRKLFWLALCHGVHRRTTVQRWIQLSNHFRLFRDITRHLKRN